MKTATRDLLRWIAAEPRTYPEAIDVWQTTCPQHSIWEDAVADGLVEVVRGDAQAHVRVTSRGRAALAEA